MQERAGGMEMMKGGGEDMEVSPPTPPYSNPRGLVFQAPHQLSHLVATPFLILSFPPTHITLFSLQSPNHGAHWSLSPREDG